MRSLSDGEDEGVSEPAELEAFCRERLPKVVGLLSLYCDNRDVAEGLAQDVMAVICRDWKKVRKMASPDAWVHRVAINCANSFHRRRRAESRAHKRLQAEVPASDMEQDPSAVLAIREAVSRLPKRQRSALVLRYYADLSVYETAELMGCSPGTIKALTHKAIGRLRRDDLAREVEVFRGA